MLGTGQAGWYQVQTWGLAALALVLPLGSRSFAQCAFHWLGCGAPFVKRARNPVSERLAGR